MNTIFAVYRHGANHGWTADQVIAEIKRRFVRGTKLGDKHIRAQYADTVMQDRMKLVRMCGELRATLSPFSPDGKPRVPKPDDPAWALVPIALQESAKLMQELTPDPDTKAT